MIKSDTTLYRSVLKQEDYDFPLPKSLATTNLFMRYLCGEVSKHYINSEINELFFDLEKFIEVWFEYSDKRNILFEIIRKSGDGFKTMVGKLIDEVKNIKLTKVQLDKVFNKKTISVLQADLLESLDELNTKIDLYSNLDIETIKSEILNKGLFQELPDSYITTIIVYAKASVKTNRNVNKSDAGDIMHAIYLPYCDLWRTDRSFSNILIKEKIENYEGIVPALSDLPSRIEELLEKK